MKTVTTCKVVFMLLLLQCLLQMNLFAATEWEQLITGEINAFPYETSVTPDFSINVSGLNATATMKGTFTGSGTILGWRIFINNESKSFDEPYQVTSNSLSKSMNFTLSPGGSSTVNARAQVYVKSGSSYYIYKTTKQTKTVTAESEWNLLLSGKITPQEYETNVTPDFSINVSSLNATATMKGTFTGSGTILGWRIFINNESKSFDEPYQVTSNSLSKSMNFTLSPGGSSTVNARAQVYVKSGSSYYIYKTTKQTKTVTAESEWNLLLSGKITPQEYETNVTPDFSINVSSLNATATMKGTFTGSGTILGWRIFINNESKSFDEPYQVTDKSLSKSMSFTLSPGGSSTVNARAQVYVKNGSSYYIYKTTKQIKTVTADNAKEETQIRYGDLNNDRNVNAIDFALFRQYLLSSKNEIPNLQAADLNGDAEVNAIDFAIFRQYLLGMINEFPVSKKELKPAYGDMYYLTDLVDSYKGSVQWDEETKIATASLNYTTKKYHIENGTVINEPGMEIKDNKLVMTKEIFNKEFYSVEAGEDYLSNLVDKSNIVFNNDNSIATVTLNGIKKEYYLKDHKVINSKIVVSKSDFEYDFNLGLADGEVYLRKLVENTPGTAIEWDVTNRCAIVTYQDRRKEYHPGDCGIRFLNDRVVVKPDELDYIMHNQKPVIEVKNASKSTVSLQVVFPFDGVDGNYLRLRYVDGGEWVNFSPNSSLNHGLYVFGNLKPGSEVEIEQGWINDYSGTNKIKQRLQYNEPVLTLDAAGINGIAALVQYPYCDDPSNRLYVEKNGTKQEINCKNVGAPVQESATDGNYLITQGLVGGEQYKVIITWIQENVQYSETATIVAGTKVRWYSKLDGSITDLFENDSRGSDLVSADYETILFSSVDGRIKTFKAFELANALRSNWLKATDLVTIYKKDGTTESVTAIKLNKQTDYLTKFDRVVIKKGNSYLSITADKLPGKVHDGWQYINTELAPFTVIPNVYNDIVELAQGYMFTMNYLRCSDLFDLGSYGCDGKWAFNGYTYKAIQKFQKENGLPVTGKLDPTTFAVLQYAGNNARVTLSSGSLAGRVRETVERIDVITPKATSQSSEKKNIVYATPTPTPNLIPTPVAGPKPAVTPPPVTTHVGSGTISPVFTNKSLEGLNLDQYVNMGNIRYSDFLVAEAFITAMHHIEYAINRLCQYGSGIDPEFEGLTAGREYERRLNDAQYNFTTYVGIHFGVDVAMALTIDEGASEKHEAARNAAAMTLTNPYTAPAAPFVYGGTALSLAVIDVQYNAEPSVTAPVFNKLEEYFGIGKKFALAFQLSNAVNSNPFWRYLVTYKGNTIFAPDNQTARGVQAKKFIKELLYTKTLAANEIYDEDHLKTLNSDELRFLEYFTMFYIEQVILINENYAQNNALLEKYIEEVKTEFEKMYCPPDYSDRTYDVLFNPTKWYKP